MSRCNLNKIEDEILMSWNNVRTSRLTDHIIFRVFKSNQGREMILVWYYNTVLLYNVPFLNVKGHRSFKLDSLEHKIKKMTILCDEICRSVYDLIIH